MPLMPLNKKKSFTTFKPCSVVGRTLVFNDKSQHQIPFLQHTIFDREQVMQPKPQFLANGAL